MTSIPVKGIRYVGFGLTILFAVLGCVFIIGETFVEPGNPAAAILVALWFLPMVALSVYGLRRPEAATKVMLVVAALVSLFVVLEQFFRGVTENAGPIGSIAVFAVSVALGLLGLRRPLPAGSLMILLGATSLGAALSRSVGSGDGASIGDALGASSGAVALPALVIGGLYLVAAAGQAWRGHRSHGVGSAHIVGGA
jgi:hypothetical protein